MEFKARIYISYIHSKNCCYTKKDDINLESWIGRNLHNDPNVQRQVILTPIRHEYGDPHQLEEVESTIEQLTRLRKRSENANLPHTKESRHHKEEKQQHQPP